MLDIKQHKNTLCRLLLFLLFVAAPLFSLDARESDSVGLDMNEIVSSHMGDAYEWPILSRANGKGITLYLPIIVYSSERGWNFFMSSKLQDATTYKGFKIAEQGSMYEGKLVELSGGEWKRPLLDLSFTKVALSLVINSVILVLIILSVSRWYRNNDSKSKAPGGFIGFMEMFIMMIYDDVIRDTIGVRAKKFAPYLLTVFFFIFINNMISLVPLFPGGVGVTGNIAITLVLALCTFLVVNLFGSKHYWRDVFWPDVPLFLKVPIPLLPIIEFMGVFTKPFALMIRLFANMMAGHMAILIFVCLIFMATKMGPALQGGLTVLSVLFTLFMNLLELLVAFIQAYVFTLLSAVFIGLAQEGRSEEQ